ncbi:hypothetical protein GQ607_014773 [Colletotrichum asianum]|uniref:Uncharacterized protein n=1 Tax=Colletotrichum asianum TaxID=702518 RepID=A0A8H3W4B7_9PEZI|nr:hypothetical protein GQ607_014773 [Colletotrichum asianum]
MQRPRTNVNASELRLLSTEPPCATPAVASIRYGERKLFLRLKEQPTNRASAHNRQNSHVGTLTPVEASKNCARSIAMASSTTRGSMRRTAKIELDQPGGRTQNLLIPRWIVVRRLAIGPTGHHPRGLDVELLR